MQPNKSVEEIKCRRCGMLLKDCPRKRWTNPLCVVDGVEWDEHVIGLSALTEQLEELERWVGGYKLIEKEQGFSNDINLFMSKDLYRKANGYNEAIDDILSHIREQKEIIKNSK